MDFSLNALKFEDIRTDVINYLIAQNPNFETFDFTAGSNVSLIVNAMAYMTMLLNYNLSNIANNIFLDTTNVRRNAVSIAKSMGYIPKRTISATITGSFNYSGSNFNTSSQVVIAQNSVFLSVPSGYSFVNLQPIILSYVSPILLSSNFLLTQGTWTNYSYISNGLPFQSFVIPDTTVENTNVILTSNNSQNIVTNWNKVQTFTQIIPDSPIYFIQESNNQEYCPLFLFGNGTVGKIPTTNDIITVEYLSSMGALANNETGISIPATLIPTTSPDITFNSQNLTVSIPTNVTSVGGNAPETIASIQTQAPLYFSTSGSAITKQDYINILTDTIDSIYFNVAGAEDIYGNNPQYLGNTYICGVPILTSYINQQNLYLSPLQEGQIISSLKEVSLLGIFKNVIKPTYIYVDIITNISIASNTSQQTINLILANVNTALNNYYRSMTNQLGESYTNSQVITAVNSVQGVVSSIIEPSYGFLINNNSFYNAENNFINLPVIYKKDINGDIIYNNYNIPETVNFIKTNSTIVEETNQTQNTTYTVETLPPSLSSIYGELSVENINRVMYSQDYVVLDMLNVFITNNIGGIIGISFQPLQFQDINNTNHSLSLIDSGASNTWNIYLDNEAIGQLIYNNGFSVTINPTQVSYLSGLGFGNTINVVEYNLSTSQTYYQLQTVLADSNLANIQIEGSNILGQLQYTTTTNNLTNQTTSTITLNNPLNLTYGGTSYPVSLAQVTSSSAILMAGSYTLANISYTNSIFTLSALQGTNLNLFGFQNTITLDTLNNLNVLDIYNNASIGTFNYLTGLLQFNSLIQGNTGTSLVETPISQLFNGYSNTSPVNVISIVPNNQYNSKGQIIGTLTDFNGQWNQFIVPNINPATLI